MVDKKITYRGEFYSLYNYSSNISCHIIHCESGDF